MANKPVLTPQQQSVFNDALSTGIQKQDVDMITLALQNGAAANILLFAGIRHKPTKMQRFFDVDTDFGIKMMQLAVDYGADVKATKDALYNDKKPNAALHWAHCSFDEKKMDFLLDRGAPVDTRDSYDDTALMDAVRKADPVRIKYYLDKGADPMAACGDKKEFPLQVLESSDKFKPRVKDELAKLMMKKSIPAAEPPAAALPDGAATAFNGASSEVALHQDIEVPHPLELKTHDSKPQKNFTL